MHMYLNKIK